MKTVKAKELSSHKMSLLIAEGLDYMGFKGPFQPKPLYDSMLEKEV